MAKYEIGQSYKAIWQDGTKSSFKVLEKGYGLNADLFHICWEDGYEETAYKTDMDFWVE